MAVWGGSLELLLKGVTRYPRGTRVDPNTGAGGGRFAPGTALGGELPRAVPGYLSNWLDKLTVPWDWNEKLILNELKIDPEQWSRQAFAQKLEFDLGNGVTSRVHTVDAALEKTSGLRHVRITGDFFGPDGKSIGSFERWVSRDGEGNLAVENVDMRLDNASRNKGTALEFYKRSEEEWAKMGVKYVMLYADSSVGKYAWARMGYDFQSDEQREVFSQSFRNFVKDQTRGQVTVPDKILTAWDIAGFDVPVYRNGFGWSLGKQFFLTKVRGWDAMKILDPRDKGMRIGEAYYHLKRERAK